MKRVSGLYYIDWDEYDQGSIQVNQSGLKEQCVNESES
jgi:hypothetical protein